MLLCVYMAVPPSPRLSPFEAVKETVLSRLLVVGEKGNDAVVECCSLLPRQLRLQRVHDYLTTLLVQHASGVGFPGTAAGDLLTASTDVCLRVRRTPYPVSSRNVHLV